MGRDPPSHPELVPASRMYLPIMKHFTGDVDPPNLFQVNFVIRKRSWSQEGHPHSQLAAVGGGSDMWVISEMSSILGDIMIV